MTILITRIFSGLISATLAAHLIARSRIWFHGAQNAQDHLEAVLLGLLFGALIVSLVSLIKLILGRLLLATRIEIIVDQSPNPIHVTDEHHPGDALYPQVQSTEDQRRQYSLEDSFEIEMHGEMV